MGPNDYSDACLPPPVKSRPSVTLNLKKESIGVVILNLDTKISVAVMCRAACHKCFLLNEEVELASRSLGTAQSLQPAT